ncbi:MAG TPA: ribosome biogenesis GTP-binding protein YihA/YsxC [Polyangiaceae bacterium]|nr:ribosome biogenesis GTP-binding protein YihA/YsxC [Polyangiaceae bacterium]
MTKEAGSVSCPFVDAQFRAQAKTLDQLPAPTNVEVAFAGRSNVGKSRLLNAIFERKNLVRTSQTPGCTQAINFFEARTRDGTVLHFVDLPGYGYAERSKAMRRHWGDLIDGYLSSRPSLRAVVLLVDVRRDFGTEERELIDWLSQSHVAVRPALSVIVVATKTDQMHRSALPLRLQNLSEMAGTNVMGVSIRDAASIARLRSCLLRTVVPSQAPSRGPAATTPAKE